MSSRKKRKKHCSYIFMNQIASQRDLQEMAIGKRSAARTAAVAELNSVIKIWSTLQILASPRFCLQQRGSRVPRQFLLDGRIAQTSSDPLQTLGGPRNDIFIRRVASAS